VPEPSRSLSAVIVSGGKQYRVALGDRILVDRLAAEAGSELTLDRVLLVADGDDVKVGAPGIEGVTVTARVVGDRRGKKIDVLRYKSKKRVRVHRGARADLTALEILTIAGQGQEPKAAAEPKAGRPPATRGRVKPQPGAKVEAPAAVAGPESAAAEAEVEAEVEAPKAPRRARPKAAPKASEASEAAAGAEPGSTEEAPDTDGA